MEIKKDTWQLLDNLKPFIREAWERHKFSKPTPIQFKSIPQILEGKDVIAHSPIGTGKTLAYLIPLLEKIDPLNKNVQGLILVPSHELAMQIYGVIKEWTEKTQIVSTPLIGGANINKQIEKLKEKPHLVVGTVGRIIELINLKKLKTHGIKTIVLDEFDALMAAEHINKIQTIIKATLRDRQILCFSATLPKEVKELAFSITNDPKLIEIHKEEKDNNTQHFYIEVEARKKVDLLSKILKNEKMKVLCFVNNHHKLLELEAKLIFKGHVFKTLSSNTGKRERVEAIQSFKKGIVMTLLATEVSARGLDIPGITHVINYDIPFDEKGYIHRTGRCGRMGAKGTVISLVTKNEALQLKRICRKIKGISLKEKVLSYGKLVDPQ
ncbi:Superfamily II DNA and RNA helicase [Anaerobranca californiensis DSM 14826]|jgi:superfamily II DNA/RNA helicase|uniref:Superfamily II DNA and RNA helicase n=1 Tax=Anaerobranca californiensis DSM 14826 TaxID=1120989 RepID=A0A1M6M5G2_9FIRM|nr:DEAD/DEAH box helicase [Anaerobranca californiensis]SHJ78679.1 Superfamily II DNA and RNA helicase [Anaerobranca californiensis DSM 14826]